MMKSTIKNCCLLLLAGAVVATTSCSKDYDNELRDLQSQIDDANSSTLDKFESVEDVLADYGIDLEDLAALSDNLQTQIDILEASLEQAIEDEAAAREAGDDELAEDLADLQTALSDQIAAWNTAQAIYDEKLNSLNGYIDNLEDDMDDLEEDMAALEAALEALEEKLEGEDDDLQDQINTINNTLTTIQNSITNNSSAISANASDIAELAEAVAALETTDTDLQKQITDLSTSLTALASTVSNNTTNIALNASDINALEIQFAALSLSLSDLAAEVASYSGDITSLFTLYTSLEIDISQWSDDIITNAYNIAENAEAIGLNADEIAALQEDLATLEELVGDNYDDLSDQIAATIAALSQAQADNEAALESAINDLEGADAEILQALAVAVGVQADVDADQDAYMEALTYALRGLAADLATNYYTSAEITEMNAELQELISDLDTRVSALETTVEDLQSQIDDLADTIETLLNQVETVAFAADYRNDYGVDIIPMDVYKTGDASTITATYTLSPKSSVSEVIEAYEAGKIDFSYLINKSEVISRASTDELAFEIVSVAKAAGESNAITVTATTTACPILNDKEVCDDFSIALKLKSNYLATYVMSTYTTVSMYGVYTVDPQLEPDVAVELMDAADVFDLITYEYTEDSSDWSVVDNYNRSYLTNIIGAWNEPQYTSYESGYITSSNFNVASFDADLTAATNESMDEAGVTPVVTLEFLGQCYNNTGYFSATDGRCVYYTNSLVIKGQNVGSQSVALGVISTIDKPTDFWFKSTATGCNDNGIVRVMGKLTATYSDDAGYVYQIVERAVCFSVESKTSAGLGLSDYENDEA